MENLMGTLQASAFQPGDSPDQTTSEASSMDIQQFPRNGWTAADIKRCLGCTDVDYNNLYGKVEEAMRRADLIEVSLTGQQKTKLFGILDAVTPHDSLPTVPDYLRIKALHQLAIKVNGNVKKRSGHAHHRKRTKNRPRITVPIPETQLSHSEPEVSRPNPPPLRPPQPAPLIADIGVYRGLGSMLLLAERGDGTQSICSLKHIARNVKAGAPITVENVSLSAWKSLLKKDGVIRDPSDEASIRWQWGERLVKIQSDGALRTVVEFMSTHGGFIDFRIDSSNSGEQVSF